MRMVKCYKTKNLDSYYLEMLNRTENSILHEKISKLMLEKNKLEQENKNLKSDLSLVIKERDDNIEQNKTLKDNVEFLHSCLDDRDKSIELMKEENIKLREENSYRAKVVDIIPQDEKSVAEETIQDLQERIRFLEQCLDNKEKVNKSLREENKRLSDFLECEA